MLISIFMGNEEKYIEYILEKLQRNFDILKNFHHLNYNYDVKAELNIISEKFVFTPEVKLFGFENNEVFLIRKSSDLASASIKQELLNLKSTIKSIAPPYKDHMSTTVTLVLVSNETVPNETEKYVKRFFCQKGYALGFRGWVDLTVIVISLSDGRVISNRKNKKTAAFFIPNEAVSREKL